MNRILKVIFLASVIFITGAKSCFADDISTDAYYTFDEIALLSQYHDIKLSDLDDEQRLKLNTTGKVNLTLSQNFDILIDTLKDLAKGTDVTVKKEIKDGDVIYTFFRSEDSYFEIRKSNGSISINNEGLFISSLYIHKFKHLFSSIEGTDMNLQGKDLNLAKEALIDYRILGSFLYKNLTPLQDTVVTKLNTKYNIVRVDLCDYLGKDKDNDVKSAKDDIGWRDVDDVVSDKSTDNEPVKEEKKEVKKVKSVDKSNDKFVMDKKTVLTIVVGIVALVIFIGFIKFIRGSR